jgi:hypothetical protein
MLQDYTKLTDDQLEDLEKQTLRMIVQAIQEYSREAREIFQNTRADRKSEVIVLAEDLVQYALEVAECYPINQRFAGFIDYKRIRWLPTPYGLFPQVLLVDAKASTEKNRETLQQSQLPMAAEFPSSKQPGKIVKMAPGVPPDQPIRTDSGNPLRAVTTSAFIHFHYTDLKNVSSPYRTLHAIYVLLLPHGRLKSRYNPDHTRTFFGEGKHSPKRGEEPRIRVYFSRLRKMCPWRLQELSYPASTSIGYTHPLWRDVQPGPQGPIEKSLPFEFIGR